MKISDKWLSEDYWQGRLLCAIVTLLMFEPIMFSIAKLFGGNTTKFTVAFSVANMIMIFYLSLYVIGCFENDKQI